MKSEGHRCSGSGYGHPHGKDKHVERVKRVKPNTRTPTERLAALDARFGFGKGAKKERARLEAQR